MKQAAITERDPRAKAAIRRWDELKTERANHEQDWESIAELIRPQRGAFSSDDHTTRHAKKPLSSRPIMAGSTFASELFSSVTNPANRWFSMSTPDDQLNEWKPMKLWLQNSTQIVNASFGPNVSAFYPAALQLYADVACFGNSCQYDQIDNFEQRIVDVTLSLAEVVFGIDAHGFVNEAVRRYSLTPVQAARLFKGKGELPARVTDAAEKGSTDKHVYYQHVTRNDDYTPGRIGKSGKRWLSRTACEVAETLVRESGYDEMPFYCPRWDVESGETYGTGPGFIALASSRAVHEMDAATLRAAQNAADPTKLAPDRAAWPIHGRVRPGERSVRRHPVAGRRGVRRRRPVHDRRRVRGRCVSGRAHGVRGRWPLRHVELRSGDGRVRVERRRRDLRRRERVHRGRRVRSGRVHRHPGDLRRRRAVHHGRLRRRARQHQRRPVACESVELR